MIHHHVAYGRAEDACTEPHCLTHQLFAMNIVEQVCLQLVVRSSLTLHHDLSENSPSKTVCH